MKASDIEVAEDGSSGGTDPIGIGQARARSASLLL